MLKNVITFILGQTFFYRIPALLWDASLREMHLNTGREYIPWPTVTDRELIVTWPCMYLPRESCFKTCELTPKAQFHWHWVGYGCGSPLLLCR